MTNLEVQALERLAEEGGILLVAGIPEKTVSATVGEPIPGVRVYQRLAEKGFVARVGETFQLTDDGWSATARAA